MAFGHVLYSPVRDSVAQDGLAFVPLPCGSGKGVEIQVGSQKWKNKNNIIFLINLYISYTKWLQMYVFCLDRHGVVNTMHRVLKRKDAIAQD